MGRVACETLVTTGPASSPAKSPPRPTWTFSGSCAAPSTTSATTTPSTASTPTPAACINLIQSQSPDIAMGVDTGGAGDQGLMFGYACDETPELMPLPIMLAHKLCSGSPTCAANGELDWLRPDGKSQVTVEYVGQQAGAHRRGGGFHAAQPRRRHTKSCAREVTEAHHRRRWFPRRWWTQTPSTTSTRPAGSSSADRTATPA